MKIVALIAAVALGGSAVLPSGVGRAALVARPARASEVIAHGVRSGVSRRLHVLSGEGGWRVAARCVRVRGSNYRRFRCAVWAQSTVRAQDFWRTHVVVRCLWPLSVCSWTAVDRFPVP